MNYQHEEKIINILNDMSKTLKRTNDFLSLLVYTQSCKLDEKNKSSVHNCLKDMT